MTAAGTGTVGGIGDPLRRAVLAALVLYLAPVALVVLLIGGIGIACCAVLRWFGGTARPDGDRLRPDGPGRAVGAPHVLRPTRSRSPIR